MLEKKDRNQLIIKRKAEGATYKELEDELGISRNTMAKIIYRYKLNQKLRELETKE